MTGTRFVARVSRWRTGLLIALGLGFIALGIWLIERPGPTVFGWLAVVVFGSLVLMHMRELFRTGPVLEIDERGLLWRRWSDTRIPWTEIERVALRAPRGQQYLCVWLGDRHTYRSTRLIGLLSWVNRLFGLGDFMLSPAGTDRKLDELVKAIAAHVRIRHK